MGGEIMTRVCGETRYCNASLQDTRMPPLLSTGCTQHEHRSKEKTLILCVNRTEEYCILKIVIIIIKTFTCVFVLW